MPDRKDQPVEGRKVREGSMSRSYMKYLYADIKRQKQREQTLLTGLFTSKYGDEFMLHFVCPLCGEQLNVYKKLGFKTAEINFADEVMGHMVQELKVALAKHYNGLCGTTTKRRVEVGEILIDKYMDKVYQ